ncbi:phosphatidylglycerophosphatase A [Thalassococcus sp. S3]|uniref:phosphatidylglycerophosphatase A family protein n=1 Tax=Thalassococcus sp. S3 TaxID=2017482 RepID=UPI0010240239|nr:phosphatidylglycerophosphatase A [Thalassococcus sp. S3]QBF31733.1 phosphatidylglycerophosphatase A [Thalassococcus sp. S3]
MSALARIISTLGGIGYLRPGPGTWGSLAALPLAWAIHILGGFTFFLVVLVAVTLVGWWAVRTTTQDLAEHDPSEIVIDEVAGQWVALLPLSYSATTMQLDISALWPGWIAAFVLFRLFDIFKPGPVRWADRRGDALGVMLDDLVAGLIAAVGVILLAGLAHGVLGI